MSSGSAATLGQVCECGQTPARSPLSGGRPVDQSIRPTKSLAGTYSAAPIPAWGRLRHPPFDCRPRRHPIDPRSVVGLIFPAFPLVVDILWTGREMVFQAAPEWILGGEKLASADALVPRSRHYCRANRSSLLRPTAAVTDDRNVFIHEAALTALPHARYRSPGHESGREGHNPWPRR